LVIKNEFGGTEIGRLDGKTSLARQLFQIREVAQ
jgi:hypothetical protein